MTRFANFKPIPVHKISHEKTGYQHNVPFLIVSPQEQQAWSLHCQHFNLTELNPVGCCVLSTKC